MNSQAMLQMLSAGMKPNPGHGLEVPNQKPNPGHGLEVPTSLQRQGGAFAPGAQPAPTVPASPVTPDPASLQRPGQAFGIDPAELNQQPSVFAGGSASFNEQNGGMMGSSQMHPMIQSLMKMMRGAQ